MDWFTVGFPSEQQEELTRRFQVRKNYLLSLALLLAAEYGGDDAPNVFPALLEVQGRLSGFRKMQRRTCVDESRVRQFLVLSWASETQLAVGNWGGNGPALPYTNAWAPVHAYYAVYAAAQAWFSADGAAPQNDHTALLRSLSTAVSSRKIMPIPWCVCCRGSRDLGTLSFSGTPVGADCSPDIQVLENPCLETVWPRFGKMLQTTRDRVLRARCTEWKKRQHRQRMHRREKESMESALTPTTLFDFLWRMRVASNYGDVELYLTSLPGAEWHRQFYNSLCMVVGATCLLLESLILRRVGITVYDEASRDFIAGVRATADHPAQFLRLRRNVLLGVS